MSRSRVYSLNDEDFKALIASKFSYSDCLRELGLTPRGGSSSKILKRRIQDLGCSVDHFSPTASQAYQIYSLDEILVQHSTYSNTGRLKIRLINEGLLENQCKCCGLTEWLGKPISLQLHHKDGDNTNNTLDNLELLCPNCHSQTETFCGKNVGA